jgi:hypothetical protein
MRSCGQLRVSSAETCPHQSRPGQSSAADRETGDRETFHSDCDKDIHQRSKDENPWEFGSKEAIIHHGAPERRGTTCLRTDLGTLTSRAER